MSTKKDSSNDDDGADQGQGHQGGIQPVGDNDGVESIRSVTISNDQQSQHAAGHGIPSIISSLPAAILQLPQQIVAITSGSRQSGSATSANPNRNRPAFYVRPNVDQPMIDGSSHQRVTSHDDSVYGYRSNNDNMEDLDNVDDETYLTQMNSVFSEVVNIYNERDGRRKDNDSVSSEDLDASPTMLPNTAIPPYHPGNNQTCQQRVHSLHFYCTNQRLSNFTYNLVGGVKDAASLGIAYMSNEMREAQNCWRQKEHDGRIGLQPRQLSSREELVYDGGVEGSQEHLRIPGSDEVRRQLRRQIQPIQLNINNVIRVPRNQEGQLNAGQQNVNPQQPDVPPNEQHIRILRLFNGMRSLINQPWTIFVVYLVLRWYTSTHYGFTEDQELGIMTGVITIMISTINPNTQAAAAFLLIAETIFQGLRTMMTVSAQSQQVTLHSSVSNMSPQSIMPSIGSFALIALDAVAAAINPMLMTSIHATNAPVVEDDSGVIISGEQRNDNANLRAPVEAQLISEIVQQDDPLFSLIVDITPVIASGGIQSVVEQYIEYFRRSRTRIMTQVSVQIRRHEERGESVSLNPWNYIIPAINRHIAMIPQTAELEGYLQRLNAFREWMLEEQSAYGQVQQYKLPK